LLLLASSGLATAGDHDVAEQFERLKRDRNKILADFIVPVEQCLRRRDTHHAAFHGCIDWHSAVHGTWALVKYTRLSGEKKHIPLIQEMLRKENVEAEFRLLQKNPDFEMPYGRAWFLRLALEHKATFNSDLLIPMGDYVASSLIEHYRRSPAGPLEREYNNASWALINLYDYGVSRQDRATASFVEEIVRQHFVPITQPCPVQNEENVWPDFMAVCTTWAYLVAHGSPSLNVQEWLGRFFPAGAVITPIRQPRGAHHMGMNFSRSWGFWRLFKATKNPFYLKLYLDHFELQYKNSLWWKGDYRAVGHWVAQFGVFALAPVFSE